MRSKKFSDHYYYHLTPWKFFIPVLTGGFFHGDFKSSHVFGTILSILADFNSTTTSRVSFLPLIILFSRILFQAFDERSRATITTGITVTFMFYSFFFCSLIRTKYFSIFLLYFICMLWSAETVKSTRWLVLFFYC